MGRIYIDYDEIEEIVIKADKTVEIDLYQNGGVKFRYRLKQTERTNKLRKHLCSDPEPKEAK